MGYTAAQYFKPSSKNPPPFYAGYVDAVSRDDLRDGESPAMLNMRVDGQGASIRPGYSLWHPFGGSVAPKGIGVFYQSRTNTADRILVYHDGLVKSIDPSLQTPSPVTCTGAAFAGTGRMNFVSTPDACYCMNGSDPYTKLVGNTLSRPSTGVAGLAPKKGVIFNNDLFVAGTAKVSTVTTTTVSRSRYTDPATGFPTVELVLASNQFGVGDGVDFSGIGGDNYNGVVQLTYSSGNTVRYIKGGTLETVTADTGGTATLMSGYGAADNFVYKAGANFDTFSGAGSAQYKFPEPLTGIAVGMEALFYFTKKGVHVTRMQDLQQVAGVYTYANRPVDASEGSAGFDTVVVGGDAIFYLTPSNKINIIVRDNSQLGFSIRELTHEKLIGVPGFMAALHPDQSGAFGYYKPAESIVVFHLRSRNSSVNDVTLEYSTDYKHFMPGGSKFFYAATEYRGRYFACSQMEAKLFEDEVGYDDDGAAIPYFYWTKDFCPSGKVRRNCFWTCELYGEMNDNSSPTFVTMVDGATRYTKTLRRTNPQRQDGGMASKTVAGSPVGAYGEDSGQLYPWSLIVTKGNLGVRGTRLRQGVYGSDIGGRLRVQSFAFAYEPLPQEAAKNIVTP